MDNIKIKIELFKKLTEDYSQAAYRRAGLYGLSAVGVALYQRNVNKDLTITLFRKKLNSLKASSVQL